MMKHKLLMLKDLIVLYSKELSFCCIAMINLTPNYVTSNNASSGLREKLYFPNTYLPFYILGIFSKTEQYFLLLDKLSPDSVMASSRSEENVVLNKFQHKSCISVGIPS